jgi:hypothetical protein
MPAFGTTAAHWHMQALEARIMAANLVNFELRAATLKIANQYDQLAERSAPSANASNIRGRVGRDCSSKSSPQQFPLRVRSH